jgi:lambda family phage portal protein
MGYQPSAAVQRQVAQAAHRVAAHAAGQQRSLMAALTGNDTASWVADGLQINASTESGLATVRARSRDAALNNPWARQFLAMCQRNVLGPHSVRYQSRVTTADGKPQAAVNDALEAGYAAFSRRGACDITGRYTLQTLRRLALLQVVTDGEAFIRLYPGRGPHGFQVKLLTADHVPISARANLSGGRRVRQGIEMDSDGRVLAYHMVRDEAQLEVSTEGIGPQGLERVPAAQIIHLYRPEQAGQIRGIPWLAPVLKSAWQAQDFAASGLNKARESAKRGGWLTSTGEHDPGNQIKTLTDAEQPQADQPAAVPASTLHDGTWEQLAHGLQAVPFESDYPNIEYGEFTKACVRNIACAWGVSYITLGNDLEAVNYSSGQLGLEGERTLWLEVQNWLVDELERPIHAGWLRHALLAAPELSALSMARLPVYEAAARWQTHRWQPLDPLKTIEAQAARIQAKLSSPQREIRAAGEDPDEILAELREWQMLTKDLAPPAPQPADAAATQAAQAASDAAKARRLTLIQSAS